MNAITYLQQQLAGVNAVFHSVADDLTEEEWASRPAPGQNIFGYSVWHIPRAQDSTVQTWIRGIPEVIHGDRWADWRRLQRYGNGGGVSLAEADDIAQSIQRADVVEYADKVHQEISRWLAELDESNLDMLPDYSQHLSAYPEYHTPGYLELVRDTFDKPIWYKLRGPCIGHSYRHLGGLEIVKDIMRKGK